MTPSPEVNRDFRARLSSTRPVDSLVVGGGRQVVEVGVLGLVG